MSALTSRVGMGTASTVAPSLGKGQARPRRCYRDFLRLCGCRSATQVSAVCRPREPGLSCREKEKTVFVKAVERKIWELLDEGIDMWVAVNGKRVDRNATMAQNWDT